MLDSTSPQQTDSKLQNLLQKSYAIPFIRMVKYSDNNVKDSPELFLNEMTMLFFEIYNFRSINEHVDEISVRERDEHLLKQQWNNFSVENQNKIKEIYKNDQFINLLGYLKYIISIGRDFTQLVYPFYPSASENALGERINRMLSVVNQFFLGWERIEEEVIQVEKNEESFVPRNIFSLLDFVDGEEQKIILAKVDEACNELKTNQAKCTNKSTQVKSKRIRTSSILMQSAPLHYQIVLNFLHQTLNDYENRTAETCFYIISKLIHLPKNQNTRENRVKIFIESFENNHFLGVADLYPFSVSDQDDWITNFMKIFVDTIDQAINLPKNQDIILLLKNNKGLVSNDDESVRENLKILWSAGVGRDELQKKLSDLKEDLYNHFSISNPTYPDEEKEKKKEKEKEKEKEKKDYGLADGMTKYYRIIYLFLYITKLQKQIASTMVDYYNHHHFHLQKPVPLKPDSLMRKYSTRPAQNQNPFKLNKNRFEMYALVKLAQDILCLYDSKTNEEQQREAAKNENKSLGMALRKINQEVMAKKPISKIKLVIGGLILLLGAGLLTYVSLQTLGILPALSGVAIVLQWSISGSVTFVGAGTIGWSCLTKIKAKWYQFINDLRENLQKQPKQNVDQNISPEHLPDSDLYSRAYPGENEDIAEKPTSISVGSSSSTQREFNQSDEKRAKLNLTQAGMFAAVDQGEERIADSHAVKQKPDSEKSGGSCCII